MYGLVNPNQPWFGFSLEGITKKSMLTEVKCPFTYRGYKWNP